MKLKRTFALLMAVALLVPGCSKKQDFGQSGIPVQGAGKVDFPAVVRIGTQQMPNDENIAKAKNYFNDFGKKFGVEVKLLEFDSGAAVVNAIVSKSIDLGLMGTTPATTAISNNLGVELIWIHSILGKSEALVVRNSVGLNSIVELAGKKIATPFGSTAHYSLLSALELDGVKESEVMLFDMQPKDIFAAWQRGDIDAAYVWDPVLGRLEGGKILVSSEDLAKRGVITADTEVVSKEFGNKYPELVAGYIKELAHAQDDYRHNFNDAVNSLATYFNTTPEDAREQMEGNVWLSAMEQLDPEYLGTSGSPGKLPDALKKTADFLQAQKSITKAPDLSVFQESVNPRYIELALKQ